ncbi:MAG TPA: NINE protein [Caldimonas sp.]|jgi:TM2 domain-containing membrane protein YozV|nr:NINE protein [Caldimonas sp.]HEX2540607.1 NINE protein [Caldimonas sp.]
MTIEARRPRSKALATWLAILGGSLGLHRFYLHGAADRWGWAYPLPTLAGAYGFWRMREFGVDDRLGSVLVPLLGASLVAAMLSAIVYGLTDDARWAARHGRPRTEPRSGWPAVLGVVLALALGATAAMATIAFTAQRYFESAARTGR